jgi:hypothetical protein
MGKEEELNWFNLIFSVAIFPVKVLKLFNRESLIISALWYFAEGFFNF